MSGGAQTKVPTIPSMLETWMMHFRNLNWGINLRQMIIRVEYFLDGKVIAR